MTETVLLTLSPETAAAVAKQRRKRESLEQLLDRLLNQRTRREEVARAQLLKSLRQKLDWHQAALRREQEAVDSLQRQLAELAEAQ